MDAHWLATSDGWRLVVDAATVAAVGFAAVAIWQAGKARSAALASVAAERRLDFEIDVLLALLDHIDDMGTPDLPLQERVRLIGKEEIPRTGWAVFLVQQSPWGVEPRAREGVRRQHYLVPDPENPGQWRNATYDISEELRAAIARRLAARG